MTATNPTPTPEPLLVDLRTAARLLSVSVRTLWSMTTDGRLPHVKIGARRLLRMTDLRAYVDAAARPAQEGGAQ
ncbi:MAG TPA: helix-turn-helix domain-containing protein [Gemmatales bacterium]|nr:helix-turn-helix domain-containing protein [Gemmatales bacterium]HMP60789.1 helix-turn-helix domain-containing protein [Gemmatales bacterium]